jgi:hypothetical protein
VPISILTPRANALDLNLDTTGGINVIRKLNIEGRVALVTSILLLALWATTTTHAQPNAEPESDKYTVTADVHECAHCKLLHSAKGRPCPHVHKHSSSRNTDFKSLVGFAEVDPTDRLFETIETDAVTSKHRVGGEYIGFAESDPTDFGAPAALITHQLVEKSAWQNPVGFAETDPTDIDGAIEVIPDEILVACQHMGSSSYNPSVIEFSGLPGLDDRS